MKRYLITTLLVALSILAIGQTPPPKVDTVKVATVFNNLSTADSYLSKLQTANNRILQSPDLKSKEAQDITSLIFEVIDYIQKHTVSVPAPIPPKEGKK